MKPKQLTSLTWWKTLFFKYCFLSPPLTVVIALPSFVLVTAVLIHADAESPFAIIAYIISAYAAVITGTGIYRLTLLSKKKIKSKPIAQLYQNDVVFRTKASLYPSAFLSLGYAAINLFFGIRDGAPWFFALAVYYTTLVIIRLSLLSHVRHKPLGKHLVVEYKKERLCGILLLVIHQALTVMVILMVFWNRGADYPGILIYVVAAYTFYSVTLAVINLVRYRKFESPVLSAVTVLRLSAALVSLLSLETAMLTQFGAESSPAFRRTITSLTGIGVCVTVLTTAIIMIVHAQTKLNKIKKQGDDHGR